MSGSAPAPVNLRLRLSPLGRPQPGGLAGSGIRVRIEATNEIGQLIDVTGLTMWVRRPGGAVLRHNSGITRTALGLYFIDLPWDAAGQWTYEASCAGPREARSPTLSRTVDASRVIAATPPPPVLVDDAGAPMVLQDGSFWSARRVTTLDVAAALDPADQLVVVQGGTTRRASWQGLRDAAIAGAAPAVHGHAAADVSYTRVGTGTSAQALSALLAQRVSVTDYGAVCDGVTDDAAAFQRAVDDIPVGASRVIVVPRTAQLSANVLRNNRNPIWHLEPGASTNGGTLETRLTGTARWTRRVGWAEERYVFGSPDAAVGDGVRNLYTRVVSNSATPGNGYGDRYDYTSSAFGTGFDIAQGLICRWDRVQGQDLGTGDGQWLVVCSPDVGGADTRWRMNAAEWNVINRGPDTGFSKQRAPLTNHTGGLLMVPEGPALVNRPGTAQHLTFAFCVAAKDVGGTFPRWHAGILGEPRSITPSGRAIYWSGNDQPGSPENDPLAMIEADDRWQHVLKTNRATVTLHAVALGAAHRISWLDALDALLAQIGSDAAGRIVLAPGPSGAIVAAHADNTAVGGNARGAKAVDLQQERSGPGQVASGPGAILMGRNSTANGADAIAMGVANTASGFQAAALGGNNSVLDGPWSAAVAGRFAAARARYAVHIHSGGRFTASGDAQWSRQLSRAITADATPTTLTADGAAISAGNLNILPDNATYACRVSIVAQQVGGSAGTPGDCATWEVTALIRRGVGDASVVLVAGGGLSIAPTHASAGAAAWRAAVLADTNRGAAAVRGIGEADKTIRWVATTQAVEVTA